MRKSGRLIQATLKDRKRRFWLLSAVLTVPVMGPLYVVGIFFPPKLYGLAPMAGVWVFMAVVIPFTALVSMKHNDEKRSLLEEAGRLPGTSGLAALIDEASDRWPAKHRAGGGDDPRLIQDLGAALSRLEGPSPDFNIRSQKQLAEIVRSFFWMGTTARPENQAFVKHMVFAIMQSGTSKAAQDSVLALLKKRAWFDYQKQVQSTIRDAQRRPASR